MDELRREPPGTRSEQQPDGQAGSQLPLWPSEPASVTSPSRPVSSPTSGMEPPWSLADLGAFVSFALLSFLFVVLAASLFLSPGEEASRQTPFVISMQVGLEFSWLLFIYFIITTKYRRPFWQALRWVRGPQHGVNYLLGGAALAFLAPILDWTFDQFNLFPSEQPLPIEKWLSSPDAAYLLVVLGICVAPFVEELIFRGFFYPVFERLWGFWMAVLLTAVLFAAIHAPQLWGGWPEIATILVVGAVFSYCRGKTGSLLPPFLMHLAYNTCLFVSMYISTDGFRDLSG